MTLIDGVYDQPSMIDDQVRWLAAAGFNAEGVWARQDLCVIVADSPSQCRRLETIDGVFDASTAVSLNLLRAGDR